MDKIKIKKPKPPPPPKRRPGQRAGLTRELIISAALKVTEQGPFSIQSIADALEVVPAAIYAKFRGKGGEIVAEMLRSVLADVARPFHPNETWEAYFRDLFGATFHAFKGHRRLALAFGSDLSENYYLNPLLPERILHALSLAGVAENDKAKALDLVIANLIGFITVQRAGLEESGASKWLKAQSNLIDALSTSEYPQIKAHKTQLLKAAKERCEQASTAKSLPRGALRFADVLIEGLKGRFGAKPS